MASVFIKTYGCQMNERDSEQVARMMTARGYTLTNDESHADVVLLNTCSVRDMAEQKAIGKMGFLNRLRIRKPDVILGYLGCMAQSRGAELLKISPHVDLVVGTQKFHKVADYVDSLIQKRREAQMDDVRFTIVDTANEKESQNTIRDHTLAPHQSSAFVSIMQGCNMHCAFCIVPSTRGSERSRPISEIVEEVRLLADRNIREVTLLGQIVNQYGRHEFSIKNGLSPFVQLLEAVHDVEGIDRIRFTSPHPIGFRKDLIEALGRLPKLMPHVHLPLQSGSNRILKRMRRTYTSEKFERLAEDIRSRREGIAITTDIIVGFPGETDEDYQATRDLAQRVAFDNAFIFRYSQRRDTPAAEMPEQIEESVKEFRNKDLLEVVNAILHKKLDALVGTEQTVLCEGPSKTNPHRLTGRTPQNKIVVFEGEPRHIGEIFDVKIVKNLGFSLMGDPAIIAVA